MERTQYATQTIRRETIDKPQNKMTYRDWAYLFVGMCAGATLTAYWIFIITR